MNNTIIAYFTLIALVLCQVIVSSNYGVTMAAEAGQGQGHGSLMGGGSGVTVAVVVSVGIVATGLMFLAVCTFAWLLRQYRKLCPMRDRGPMRPVNMLSLGSHSRVTIKPSTSLDSMTCENTRVILTREEDNADLNTNEWFDTQQLSYPRASLSVMQEVGAGWFGLVFESEASNIVPFPRRSKVIVKVLRYEADQREQKRFLDQARIYRDSNHKNIMKLLGHCIETFPYMLVFESFPKGDLKSYLLQNSQGPKLLDNQGVNARNKMALDIANGLGWMHAHGFMHPDLTARNCLVGQEGQIVIGDFGLARVLYREDYYWGSGPSGINSSGRDIGLPIRWAAPETLLVTPTSITTQKMTIPANVWSFGVVLWEICELAKFPYLELTDEQVLTRVITDRNYTLKLPSIASMPYVTLLDKMVKIMSSCWHGVPSKRPDISHIVEILNTPL